MEEPRLTRARVLGAAAAVGLFGLGAARSAGAARMTKVALPVWDGIEELDLVGPYEVLAAWAWMTDRPVQVVTVAADRRPVRAAHGLGLVPDTTWRALGRPDVLVLGGGDSNRLVDDARYLDRLRRFARGGTLMTSVCTGALVFAAAGLLDGKPATTHWSAIGALAEYERIDVRPDARFVDAGNVVTAAGVSAGIDMALHLVARLESKARAREVRRYIQYDPAPPV